MISSVIFQLETDQLQIERTDVLVAIKEIVTSLERLSAIDADTQDNIRKLQVMQQEIPKQVDLRAGHISTTIVSASPERKRT